MATFRLQLFSSPELLGTIEPQRLLAFLEPHRAYFAERAVPLPSRGLDPIFDYPTLSRCLLNPNEQTPAPLLDGLCIVDELATFDGMDAIQRAFRQSGQQLLVPTDCTPADVALQAWMQYPQLLERLHAELYICRQRSFLYFPAAVPNTCRIHQPTDAELDAIATRLSTVFQDRNRGHTCQIFSFHQQHSSWYIIRHGEPFKREETILVNRQTASIGYRPLRYDVLVVDHRLHEIRIHAQANWERDAYLQEFGPLLFGSGTDFSDVGKYTLTPIRDDGRDCLVCTDINGLEQVRLRELEWVWSGMQRTTEIIRSLDVFHALAALDRSIPAPIILCRAVFDLRLKGEKRTRKVTIRPPNNAIYRRDDDCYIAEEWLAKRGFLTHTPNFDEAFDLFLARY